MKRDSLGRRREPGQNRGLRPMHPPLPPGVRSRSVRVAMSVAAWTKVDRLVADSPVTAPRAVGALLERALDERVIDWQEWQIRKEQRLLERPAS